MKKEKGVVRGPLFPYGSRTMVESPVTLMIALREALVRRDRSASNEAVRALLAHDPPLGRQWKSIAAVAKQNGEISDAYEAMNRYAGPEPRSAEVIYELAALRAQSGHLASAFDLIEQIPEDIPNEEANAYTRGTIAANLGKFELARTQLRRAIEANPSSGQAWLALAMVGEVQPDDARALESAEPLMVTAPETARAPFQYALGKLRHQQDRHADAFASFSQGAALMARIRPYDARRDRASAAAAIEGWEPARPVAQLPSSGSTEAARPIFVTGLPRSGTTLVEQVLSAHSGVDGGDELGIVRLLEQEVGGKSRHAFDTWRETAASPDGLRSLYEHLLAQRFRGTGRVVDKTLNLSRYLGLITTLFPAAPIIWLRRDPLDCAWSAYRTWFLRGIDWSWSLTDISTHFKIEDELFVHWTNMLGERILVVDFAELVTEPRQVISRILDHCGLRHEEACFAPHAARRTVTTASVAQVREPINVKGLGAARPYSQFLAEFSDAYFVQSVS